MSTAIILAIVASAFWGIGHAMQKHGVDSSMPKISLREFFSEFGKVFKALFFQPIWLLGMASMVGGMTAFAYALSKGDISLVQPIVNLTMVFAAAIGVVFLKEKIYRMEIAGISVMLIGVLFIGAQQGGATSVQPTTGWLAIMSLIFVVLVVLSLLSDRTVLKGRTAISLALATGFCFGLANTMGKVLTQRVIEKVGYFSFVDLDCLLAITLDFPIWLIIFANVFGFSFFQTAFANGRVSMISPIITIISNTTPILAAIAVFQEQVGAMRGFGILLAMVGTGLLMGVKKEDISVGQEEEGVVRHEA